MAITSLVAALGTFIAVAASASTETDGLNQRLRESKAAYEESVAAIEAERTSVLNDVEALDTTVNKSASVTVNRAPALTEGQLVRTVGKVLESMGR